MAIQVTLGERMPRGLLASLAQLSGGLVGGSPAVLCARSS